VFLRKRDRLWAVAIRTLADPEEAADALQEAVIYARSGGPTASGATPGRKQLLKRIVVNACGPVAAQGARPAAGGDGRADH